MEGLLKAGALSPNEKPIWFDVHQAFPPRLPSVADRPEPVDVSVRQLVYLEDYVKNIYYTEMAAKYYLKPADLDPSNYQGENQCSQFVKKYISLIRESGVRNPRDLLERTEAAFDWETRAPTSPIPAVRPIHYEAIAEEDVMEVLSRKQGHGKRPKEGERGSLREDREVQAVFELMDSWAENHAKDLQAPAGREPHTAQGSSEGSSAGASSRQRLGQRSTRSVSRR